MLGVISIFNNGVSPHSLGILSITQNIICSTLALCLCWVRCKFYKPVNANIRSALWTRTFQPTGWLTYKSELPDLGCIKESDHEWLLSRWNTRMISFPLWGAGLTCEKCGELRKNMDFGCRFRFGSQLCLLFSLFFSKAFALRICTHSLHWIAGEKPYEEQWAGITMCPDIGKQSTRCPDVRSLKAWKTSCETFVKGLCKSR